MDSQVPNPEHPWEGAITPLDADDLRRAAVGKKVADVTFLGVGTDEELVLIFDDGTKLVVRSWDYEGYRSGLHLHRVP